MIFEVENNFCSDQGNGYGNGCGSGYGSGDKYGSGDL